MNTCISLLAAEDDYCTLLKRLNIPNRPEIHVCSHVDDVTILRAKYCEESEINDFLREMNNMSAPWRVTRTNPKEMSAGVKNIFYKEYHCQHSNVRILQDTINPRQKHCNCPAKMIITTKRIGKRCRSKDVHLPRYPTTIKLINSHNHNVGDANTAKYRDVSLEIEKKFVALFENGHSPYTALDFHQMDLQNEYGDEYFSKITDRSVCPDIHWCYRLYYSIRGQEYGERKRDVMCDAKSRLWSLKREFEECMAFHIFKDKPVISVATPLMKRVHKMVSHSGELVYVDSVGTLDKSQHRVFILMTDSIMGALPLGVIVTTTDALELGIESLLQLIADGAFYGNADGPKIIMADNSIAERATLRKVFPRAAFYLCTFNILQRLWRFLWKAENKVEKADRLVLFANVKKLLYCKTDIGLHYQFQNIVESRVAGKYDKVVKYLSDLWNEKEQWALCYRDTKLTRANSADGYGEASMRILKEKIFRSKNAYNTIQLVEFVLKKVDPYYERKLSNFADGKGFTLASQFSVYKRNDEYFDLQRVEENTFVLINKIKRAEYTVNMELEMCTCYVGLNGAPCKHQAMVVDRFDDVADNLFTPTMQERLWLRELANGGCVGDDDDDDDDDVVNVRSDWYENAQNIDDFIIESCVEEMVGENGDEPVAIAVDDDDDGDGIPVLKKKRLVNLETQMQNFCQRLRDLSRTEDGLASSEEFFKNLSKIRTDSSLAEALNAFEKYDTKPSMVYASVSKREPV